MCRNKASRCIHVRRRRLAFTHHPTAAFYKQSKREREKKSFFLILKFYCSVQIKTDMAKKRDIRYTHTHTHFNISVKKTEGFMWFSTQVRIGTDLHTPTVRWLLLLSDKWTVPSILSSMKNESCIYIQAGWNRTEPLRANSDVIYKKKSISPYLAASCR